MLFALLFALTTTFAADRVETFRGKSTVILDRLISKGFDKIQGLDVKAMREEAPEVTWKALNEGETVPGVAGGRTSAFYKREEKTVTVMADPSLFSEEAVAVLSLHETLGALGYDDRNYQISIALWAFSLTNEDNEDNKRERALEKEAFFQLVVTSGGGTSIGGGGDFIGLLVKMQTLGAVWNRRLEPAHYRSFLMIRFEASYEENEPMNKVAFDQRGDPYITVPAKLWLSKKTFDDRMLIAKMAGLLVQGIFLKNVPKFTPQASIKCKEANRELTFSWVKPIPDLLNGLKFYFRGQTCTFKLLP